MKNKTMFPQQVEKQSSKKEVIKVNNVSKCFKVHSDRPQTFKEKFITKRNDKTNIFYALNDISFEITKGSTVGLIGQNGCGKSTMLKIINRTMFPNEGNVEVMGTVSSLIELGAGFHPDLSGRENIYTNAAIFGLKKEEIDRRLPEIIAFSEIEEFIDNPIRTYSSGMYARLAFSVAIHVDADILLVDEILGVGDMNFQEKCSKKIYEMKQSGMTIIIVTHDMSTIDRLCDYVIWFDRGNLIKKGSPKILQQDYISFMANEKEIRSKIEEGKIEGNGNKNKKLDEIDPGKSSRVKLDSITKMGDHFGNGDVLITDAKLLDSKGIEKNSFHSGDSLTLKVNYECQIDPKKISVNFGTEIRTLYDVHVFGTNTKRNNIRNLIINKKGSIAITLDPIILLEGNYKIGVAIANEDETENYDHYYNVAEFKIYSTSYDIGIVKLPVSFTLDGKLLKAKEGEEF